MVLRDASGKIIFSACRYLSSFGEALETELLACSEGLDLALRQSQLPTVIETDCLQLLAAVSSTAQDRSPFMHIISEIKQLAKQSRVCTFVKVDRRKVRASHCLANFARAEQ